MSLSYRVSQLWWSLTAEPLPDPAQQEIEEILSSAQRDLFFCFQESDQWHAYRVYRTLIESGHSQPDLLTAALLHDIGKIETNLTVWDRILVVVVNRLMPRKWLEWGQGDVNSWKRPFVVGQHHPQWGAELARTAGCSAMTIELIARHQDPIPADADLPEDNLLRQLRWADDLN